MKSHDLLYIIFTALILGYPLYEKLLLKEEYRTQVLYYGYLPLAIVCVYLMARTIITTNIENRKVSRRLSNQENSTKSLRAESLKISSFEILTSYRFEYKNDLTTTFQMMKENPIKTYLVNSKEKKDSIHLVCENPKVYFPGKHTVEFKFRFTPEAPTELYGKPLGQLEVYDKVYFPWKSFTHFLAVLKVGGGSVEPSADPLMAFQVLINGRVLIDHKAPINNLNPDDVIIIFQTEPDLFKDIETRFIEL